MEQTLQLGQGLLNNTGALVGKTGAFTGRSPKDKFIVKGSLTENTVNRNDFDIAVENKYFDQLYAKMIAHLQEKESWVRDCYACADPDYRVNIWVVNETPGATNWILPVP